MNEIIKNIKQQFFAYRNGMLADTLRKAGDPHKMIFGLNLPQIMQIAAETGKNKVLATALWTDEYGCRESRLLAPMLMPSQEFTIDEAMEWCSGVECVEVADVLCHRLLRGTDFAYKLAQLLCSDAKDAMEKYVALRLIANLLSLGKIEDKAEVLATVQQFAGEESLASVLAVIKDYCEQ